MVHQSTPVHSTSTPYRKVNVHKQFIVYYVCSIVSQRLTVPHMMHIDVCYVRRYMMVYRKNIILRRARSYLRTRADITAMN